MAQASLAALVADIETADIKEAEQTDDWPRGCVVCFFEHDRYIAAASQAEAIEHRREAHPWLHAHFEREHGAS